MRKQIDGFWGHHINDVIDALIAAGPAEGEFNGVTIYADADSNRDLLYRDWSRAMSGYIASPVGPHPAAELTAAEIESDKEIEKQNEARRAEADRKYQEQAARDRADYNAVMEVAPPMERDEVKWQEGIAAQKGSGYGLGVYGFAEAWARLMQHEIAHGRKLADVADECCSMADKNFGITGFMYGCAVSVLSHCWTHGEELRRWHNLKTQIKDEGERANDSGGVLNPALLNVG